MPDFDVIEDQLPFPEDLEHLLDVLRKYFQGHPGRVVSVHVEVGKPIVGKRQWVEGDGSQVQVTPYEVLRHHKIDSITIEEKEDPIHLMVRMIRMVEKIRLHANTVVVWSVEEFRKWLCGSSLWYTQEVVEDRVLGLEIVGDRGLTNGTVIVCGTSNVASGPWALKYGVKVVI